MKFSYLLLVAALFPLSALSQGLTNAEQSQRCTDKLIQDPLYMHYVRESEKGSIVAPYQATYLLLGLSMKYCHCFDGPETEKALIGAMNKAAAGIKNLHSEVPVLPSNQTYQLGCIPRDNSDIDALLNGTFKANAPPDEPIIIMAEETSPRPQPQQTSNTTRNVEEPVQQPVSLEELGITKVPKYYALVIGISKYQFTGPGLANLDMPVKDAERFADVLVRNYYFDKANVTVLKNATREQIINTLDNLAETLTEKDNLLIFYAGHGYYDKPKDFGYWLPADAKTSTRSAWIANSTIRDYMSAIKTKHTLLITDACFGGSILKSRSVETSVQRFTEQYREPSRKAMTSGNLTVVSDKSVFLQFLLKKLEDNRDVFLSAPVLFSRIYEPIMNNAPSTPVFGPIQGAGDGGGEFIFIRRDLK